MASAPASCAAVPPEQPGVACSRWSAALRTSGLYSATLAPARALTLDPPACLVALAAPTRFVSPPLPSLACTSRTRPRSSHGQRRSRHSQERAQPAPCRCGRLARPSLSVQPTHLFVSAVATACGSRASSVPPVARDASHAHKVAHLGLALVRLPALRLAAGLSGDPRLTFRGSCLTQRPLRDHRRAHCGLASPASVGQGAHGFLAA